MSALRQIMVCKYFVCSWFMERARAFGQTRFGIRFQREECENQFQFSALFHQFVVFVYTHSRLFFFSFHWKQYTTFSSHYFRYATFTYFHFSRTLPRIDAFDVRSRVSRSPPIRQVEITVKARVKAYAKATIAAMKTSIKSSVKVSASLLALLDLLGMNFYLLQWMSDALPGH